MPFSALVFYIKSKYKHEMQDNRLEKMMEYQIKLDSYIANCLWAIALATGYRDKDNKPVLPEWHEYINPRKDSRNGVFPPDDNKVTKDLYMAHLRSLRKY